MTSAELTMESCSFSKREIWLTFAEVQVWTSILMLLLLLLLSCFSRVWLCDPIDGSPPGSPVPGILQVRTLEWVAISFSNAWKWKVKVKTLSHVQLLSDPMDCSLPGSSVHGIFQGRVLEWVAIAFSHTDVECFVNPINTVQKFWWWSFYSSLIWQAAEIVSTLVCRVEKHIACQ